jgi:hypothetical protein
LNYISLNLPYLLTASLKDRKVSEINKLKAQLENVEMATQVPRAVEECLLITIFLNKLGTPERVEFGIENPREWGITGTEGAQIDNNEENGQNCVFCLAHPVRPENTSSCC